MAATKQEALDHIAEVYEYVLSNFGFNNPFSRDLQVWMQRQWQSAGREKVKQIRRNVTAASGEKQMAQSGSSGLQLFRHPKREAQATRALLGEIEEQQAPRLQSPKPPAKKSRKPVADEPIPEDSQKPIIAMRPRAILTEYGEDKITATLLKMGIEESEIEGMGGAQKAAALKQRIKAAK